jgi:transaldolase
MEQIVLISHIFSVSTIPEATLKAFADHGELGSRIALDGGDCESVLERFVIAGINLDAQAAQLQDDGTKTFVKS